MIALGLYNNNYTIVHCLIQDVSELFVVGWYVAHSISSDNNSSRVAHDQLDCVEVENWC